MGFLGIFIIIDVIVALSLTGGHYMNDFIFGIVAAMGSYYLMEEFGYSLNLVILKCYTGIL